MVVLFMVFLQVLCMIFLFIFIREERFKE